MALVIRKLYNNYNYYFNEFEDPRVKHYPLVHSSLPVFTILAVYLYFVKKWGPEFMQNRKPYDLRNIIKFYNLFQVFFNLYFASYGLWHSYMRSDFSLSCQVLDTTNNQPYMKKLIFASFMYYLSKYVDLLDTIFFVFRKKNNQITFLHVYHHTGMVLGVYFFLRFLAGSHSSLLGIINGFVHVFMYGYYFLSSLGDNSKRFAWCKKYVTQIQLLQFAYLIIHFTIPIIKSDCTHPMFVNIVGLVQNAFMFALFFDFYRKSYMQRK